MTLGLRVLVALLLVGHGVAHLLGFVVAWRIREFAELPYSTTILGGTMDVGHMGARVLGVLWLVAALTSVAAGVAWMSQAEWAGPFVWFALALSSVLCVLGWPAARVGLVANLLIAAACYLAVMREGGRVLPP
jgi:hypothetical protein